jgi:hypothetical protein
MSEEIIQQNIKNYKKQKIDIYLSKTSFTIICNGITAKTDEWVTINQGLKKNKFSYYKICNLTAQARFQKSIFYFTKSIASGITFFLQSNNKLSLNKKTLLTKLNSLKLDILAIKFNNKIYSTKQLKNIKLIIYSKNFLLIYKLQIFILKLMFLNSK